MNSSMRKIIAVILSVLAVLTVTACNKVEDKEPSATPTVVEIPKETVEVKEEIPVEKLPFEGNLAFTADNLTDNFGETSLVLSNDGNFYGRYEKLIDEKGDGYNSKIEYNEFWGKFSHFIKLTDYMYSVELTSYGVQQEDGKEVVENNVKYVGEETYPGFLPDTEYILYLPTAPVDEVMGLVKARDYYKEIHPDIEETLDTYALYASIEGSVFFSMDDELDTAEEIEVVPNEQND